MGYKEALWALRQAVAKAEYEPGEVALPSSRIGAATTLAAEGEVPQRIIQSLPRDIPATTRRTPAWYLVDYVTKTGKIEQKQPGQGTAWGQTPQYRRDLGVGVCQWCSTIGGLGRPRLRVLGSRTVGWGRGGGSRVLAARRGTRSSGRCRGSRTTSTEPPPPDVEENDNVVTIRWMNNKVQMWNSFE